MIDNTDVSISIHAENEFVVFTIQDNEIEKVHSYVFSVEEAEEFCEMLNASITEAKENV